MSTCRISQRRTTQVSRAWPADLPIQQTYAGKTKVGQLEMTTGVDEQVVGFYVPNIS
jgi:hypothetical protein